MNKFNERFRILKDESGLSSKELSQELDIAPSTLSYYLKDREPNYDMLIKIADYFDVTIDWLVGRTDAKTTIQESLCTQIESELNLAECQKLTGEDKSYYLTCQNTLYNTMEAIYLMLVFHSGYENSLNKFLSAQLNMCTGILHNCVVNFNTLCVHTSKSNLLKLIKYGEACSDVQKRLLLYTFYKYAKYLTENDPDILDLDRTALSEITNFLLDNFNEKFPENEAVKLYDEVNNFELDEKVLSNHKFINSHE